jgi:hypothetical protein
VIRRSEKTKRLGEAQRDLGRTVNNRFAHQSVYNQLIDFMMMQSASIPRMASRTIRIEVIGLS